MGPTSKREQGRSLRTLTTILVLALLAAVLLAGTALAAAKPGKPTAKAPKGTISTTKPTFKWSKAARATKYEVRVYKGSKLLLKKTRIARRSWKCSKALPRGVSLTWKVRGKNAAGNGAWSKRLKFKVKVGPKAITAFSFQGLSPPVIGTINEAAHAIALSVPYGTDVSALVATFTTTGATVKVAGTPQVSGTTANNFSSPVTYTVTAADSSTQAYTVTVTVAAAVIGQTYGGGKIAYILQVGDPGYIAGETHGLIAATGDQSSMGIQWSIGSNYMTTGATGVALGTGAANTTAIIAAQGAPAVSYAAGLARAYNDVGGHTDWYLPSKDELRKLYLNKDAIGGSWSALYYWSSSELSPVSAWLQSFATGRQSTDVKQDLQGVRAVRSF